jgi:hypothetical protein
MSIVVHGYPTRRSSAKKIYIALAVACLALLVPAFSREQPEGSIACGWQATTIPNGIPHLNAIAGTSSSNVWAVGPGTPTLHFDGFSWSSVFTKNSSETQVLNGVSALNTIDAWAVGSSSPPMHDLKPLVFHWDGSTWVEVADHISGGAQGKSLDGVADISTSDVWAVGSICAVGVCQPLAEMFDGTQFVIHNGPEQGKYASYYSVSGDAPTDVWAVGSVSSSSPQGFVNRPIADRWDGTHWIASRLPADLGILLSVKVNSSTDVWAAGQDDINGRSRALIEHWNGSSWSIVRNPVQSSYSFLTSISGTGPNDMWVSGIRTPTPSLYHPITEHWNGSRWNEVDPNQPTIASSIAILDLGHQIVFLVGTVYGGGAFVDQYTCN